MKQILIAEDDTALREGLTAALQNDGITATAAADLAGARRILRERTFDLLLLDVNLPDGSGIDLCREVTAVQDVPVIFLTVRDAEIDEVSAFRAGACDYVKKPFSLTILQERIAAALRKRSPNHIYEDSRFRFDFTELVFSADGEKITLSPTEQKLLAVFCAHKGQILERQTLVDRIWSCDSDYIDENALSVTVKRLRDKLGADCIGTVYGMGYVWKGAKK
ncbi:MAG: response regulator transcription factor [Clostridia bacterium]|nr:response regulator transcription factor [Clostridia bacterium]MBQ8369781.1 response regulator transcription factor [Clostridia bacterium]